MKKAIFIFLFLISTGAQAAGSWGGLSVGVMATSGTGDQFVTSPGSFVGSLDYGNKLVVGVDVMPGGPQSVRVGWRTGRGLVSVGAGRQTATVNHETVGTVLYNTEKTELNLVFAEYRRGVYFGRVGSRFGSVTQRGVDGVTPVSREQSTSGAFVSFGVRVSLGGR